MAATHGNALLLLLILAVDSELGRQRRGRLELVLQRRIKGNNADLGSLSAVGDYRASNAGAASRPCAWPRFDDTVVAAPGMRQLS